MFLDPPRLYKIWLKTINLSNIHCIKYFVPNSNTSKTLPLEYVVVQTILCTPSMLTGY